MCELSNGKKHFEYIKAGVGNVVETSKGKLDFEAEKVPLPPFRPPSKVIVIANRLYCL